MYALRPTTGAISPNDKEVEKHLGPNASVRKLNELASSLSGAGRKIQWTVFLEKELAALKTSISLPLATVHDLLQYEALDRQRVIAGVASENLEEARKLALSVDELKLSVSQTATQQDVAALPVLIEKLSKQQSSQIDKVLDGSVATASALNRLESGQLAMQDTLKDLLLLLGPAASGSPFNPSPIQTSQPGRQSTARDSAPFADIGSFLRASVADMSAHFDILMTAIRQSLSAIICWFFLMSPYAQKILRSLHVIIRAPSLLLSDNIHLEDALGRTMSLPFEHFRSWRVMEAKLRDVFTGSPGEADVFNNRYHILNMKVGGNLVLGKKNWNHAITPGARLAMSIFFSNTVFREKSCPRCQVDDLTLPVNEWTTCRKCSITFRVVPRSEQDDGTSAPVPRLPDTEGVWNMLQSMNIFANPSDVRFFKRIHVVGTSSDELGLPQDLFRGYEAARRSAEAQPAAAASASDVARSSDATRSIDQVWSGMGRLVQTLSGSYNTGYDSLEAASIGVLGTGNAAAFQEMLDQYNELQRQTMLENMEMQKAQAFWNPLESMSRSDATS